MVAISPMTTSTVSIPEVRLPSNAKKYEAIATMLFIANMQLSNIAWTSENREKISTSLARISSENDDALKTFQLASEQIKTSPLPPIPSLDSFVEHLFPSPPPNAVMALTFKLCLLNFSASKLEMDKYEFDLEKRLLDKSNNFIKHIVTPDSEIIEITDRLEQTSTIITNISNYALSIQTRNNNHQYIPPYCSVDIFSSEVSEDVLEDIIEKKGSC